MPFRDEAIPNSGNEGAGQPKCEAPLLPTPPQFAMGIDQASNSSRYHPAKIGGTITNPDLTFQSSRIRISKGDCIGLSNFWISTIWKKSRGCEWQLSIWRRVRCSGTGGRFDPGVKCLHGGEFKKGVAGRYDPAATRNYIRDMSKLKQEGISFYEYQSEFMKLSL